MRRTVLFLVGLLGLLTATPAQAGIRWSIGIGLPFPFCGPCYYGPPPPYYYRPVYVAAPPAVIVQPAPVAVAVAQAPPTAPAAPAPVVTAQAVEPAYPPPPPAPGYAAPSSAPATSVVARAVSRDSAEPASLGSPDEQQRARAAVEAGKRKDRQALPRLTKLLHDDSSPQVREAAARGLGLLGDPRSLSALQYAAQADDDREVRRSAAFAAEVVRGRR
jgi:hypothetical protein